MTRSNGSVTFRALRLLSIVALLGALIAPAAAQADDPPLVYVFTLDGLDGDKVDAGNAPFLGSLIKGTDPEARTTYFPESRAIMVAETNPNHVAMATGAYAERSGIVGNSFATYGQAPNKDSCAPATDESRPPDGTSGESPECVLAPTFFQALNADPAAGEIVTAGIFGKPKLARIFAGKVGDRFAADYLWAPCAQESAEVPYCKQVPNRGFDENAIVDTTVMDEVIRTVNEGVAGDGKNFDGKGRTPNLTFVNLPAIDGTGHGTGAGEAYDTQVRASDMEIQRFVANQKAKKLWNRTVMIVLSDHSMDSTPGKTSLGQRFQAAGIPSSSFRIVQNGSAALVYLTNRRDAGRFELLKRMRAAATAGPGQGMAGLLGTPAAEALYREDNPVDGGSVNTVQGKHPAWHLTGERVGDLVVTVPEGNSFSDPVNPLAGNHGGPQTRDNFFAVAGGSPLVNRGVIPGTKGANGNTDDTEANPQQAENVDVAPTVLRLLGRGPTAQAQGRFLSEAFDMTRLPAMGAAPVTVPPPGTAAQACAVTSAFSSAGARGKGRGVSFTFARRAGARAVRVDVVQRSRGRRIGEKLAVRFTNRTKAFAWNGRAKGGRRISDGFYTVRFFSKAGDGRTEVRRVELQRRNGRFVRSADSIRRTSCGTLRSFTLQRPVFGGASNRTLGISYRLTRSGQVTVSLLRGSKSKRLAATATRGANRTFRLRLPAKGLRRGSYRIRVSVRARGRLTSATLTARRL